MSNTAEQLEPIVNGIDTSRIVSLANNMTEDENFGKFRFRASNQWLDGSRSRTAFKDFYAGGEDRTERPAALTVDADQPEYLGGQNTAPNAVEHYLGSLVSCLNTTIVAAVAKEHQLNMASANSPAMVPTTVACWKSFFVNACRRDSGSSPSQVSLMTLYSMKVANAMNPKIALTRAMRPRESSGTMTRSTSAVTANA